MSDVLVLACGALAAETRALLARSGAEPDVRFLPAELHLFPIRLAERLRLELEAARGRYRRTVVFYGACAPDLDELLASYGAVRAPGHHCFEMAAGERWEPLLAEELGTYFLTPYLARNFERLVVRGLGLHLYPEAKDEIFAPYRRVVYLDTGGSPADLRLAEAGAAYLGLPLQVEAVGVGPLASRLEAAWNASA